MEKYKCIKQLNLSTLTHYRACHSGLINFMEICKCLNIDYHGSINDVQLELILNHVDWKPSNTDWLKSKGIIDIVPEMFRDQKVYLAVPPHNSSLSHLLLTKMGDKQTHPNPKGRKVYWIVADKTFDCSYQDEPWETIEKAIRYIQSRGYTVFMGDSVVDVCKRNMQVSRL